MISKKDAEESARRAQDAVEPVIRTLGPLTPPEMVLALTICMEVILTNLIKEPHRSAMWDAAVGLIRKSIHTQGKKDALDS